MISKNKNKCYQLRSHDPNLMHNEYDKTGVLERESTVTRKVEERENAIDRERERHEEGDYLNERESDRY